MTVRPSANFKMLMPLTGAATLRPSSANGKEERTIDDAVRGNSHYIVFIIDQNAEIVAGGAVGFQCNCAFSSVGQVDLWSFDNAKAIAVFLLYSFLFSCYLSISL